MKITAVFFDLGNTLLYNEHLNNGTIRHACANLACSFVECGYPVSAEALAEAHFNRLLAYYADREVDYFESNAEILFRKTLAELGFPMVPQADIVEPVRVFYQTTQQNWHLTPGALETLATLREQHYKIGLITNASYGGDIQVLLRTHRLEPYFDSIVISAEVGCRKPKREIFEIALRGLNCAAGESVMIGDSCGKDIAGATNAGLRAIWFKRYVNLSAESASRCRSDATAMDLSEIPNLIQTLSDDEKSN